MSGDIHSKTVESSMGMSVVSGSVNDRSGPCPLFFKNETLRLFNNLPWFPHGVIKQLM